jgi:hypothetical protein
MGLPHERHAGDRHRGFVGSSIAGELTGAVVDNALLPFLGPVRLVQTSHGSPSDGNKNCNCLAFFGNPGAKFNSSLPIFWRKQHQLTYQPWVN